MSWCRIGDNPLSEAMLVCFTDAYVHHLASVSYYISLQWHHNKHDGVSNHQTHDCVLNCLFMRRSKKTSKLRVTGLCEGNSPETGEFPAQRTSNAENVSIWWRHHVLHMLPTCSDGFTHWGRVTHICISKLTGIGSDNGLSPGRRQGIIWTNAVILLIGPWGTNFSEILIGIQIFSFKKVYLKMWSAKWRPFCLGLNVLTLWRTFQGKKTLYKDFYGKYHNADVL